MPGRDQSQHTKEDGAEYEIDLSAAHIQALRTSLQPYIAHARKVAGTRRAGRCRRVPRAIDTHVIRAWAKEQGIDIKERGRVPTDVAARYRKATGHLGPP